MYYKIKRGTTINITGNYKLYLKQGLLINNLLYLVYIIYLEVCILFFKIEKSNLPFYLN